LLFFVCSQQLTGESIPSEQDLDKVQGYGSGGVLPHQGSQSRPALLGDAHKPLLPDVRRGGN